MSQSVTLADVVAYLDGYLRVREVPDYDGAVNGLQVENSGTVDRIVAAVDASQATIDGVAALGGSPAAAGSSRALLRRQPAGDRPPIPPAPDAPHHDVALYSSHLPLDAHAEVGNNAVLARLLGLELQGAFGSYRGNPIGVWGTLPQGMASRDALMARLQSVLGLADAPRLIAGGPEQVQRVGIVTGGAGTMVKEARDAGLDTFITGEGPHHTYFDAMEFGVNVFHAGHYATETVGVRALAEHLATKFVLPHSFHDHPTGM